MDIDGLVEFDSESVFDLFGCAAQELIGRPAVDAYVEPDGRQQLMKALKENGGKLIDYRARLRRADGRRILASISAQLTYDANGEIIGTEGTTRDFSREVG